MASSKGGRGGRRGGGVVAKGKGLTTQNASNFDELKQALNDRGIFINGAEFAMKDMKFDEVKEGVNGALYVLDEFGVTQHLKGFGVKDRGVMCASLDGWVYYNSQYYKNGTSSISDVMNTGSGFHPKNQNAFTTAAHEAGHIIESYIIHKSISGSSWYSQVERSDAWKKSKYSSKIISEACKSAKKTYKKQTGKTIINDQLVAMVSGYATKNRSECFAECIADYVANGSNASILSQEVWKITKNYVN